MLQAPTTGLLCKSLLLENKKVTTETYNFVYNPRFVLVVLQYDSELDVSLLTKSIRKLQPIVEERLDPSDFDWRVADPDDNDRITGYKFNSVTPFVSLYLYLSLEFVKPSQSMSGQSIRSSVKTIHTSMQYREERYEKRKTIILMDFSYLCHRLICIALTIIIILCSNILCYVAVVLLFFLQGLNEEVPIILSGAIADLGYFWMGGGHVHLKLGLCVSDLVDKVKNVKVMEVSVPRTK
jgi:prolyl-tRNA editing enzyme YbaK/EbsC (Cys-tRNA(Pro) deacylase)